MLPSDVTGEDFAQVLAHLGGPGTDPVEGAVVRFVRDTVWYTPLHVQRRARTLRDMLSTEQFVEVVGLASLANALCRLAAAVVEEP